MTKMLLGLLLLAACGGDDGDTIGPGSQSYEPPSENTGSGKPSDATSVTCGSADDCDYWFCRCEDGAVVNSALCTNGFCMNAAAACPRACAAFNHGAWTGVAGGGPQAPQPQTCGGLGSQKPACEACMKDECCSEATQCGQTSTCFPAWDCWLACNGDSFCEDECRDTYPSGSVAFDRLRLCLTDNCASECVGDL